MSHLEIALLVGAALVSGVALGFGFALVVAKGVGREARRGLLEFDTPAARKAVGRPWW